MPLDRSAPQSFASRHNGFTSAFGYANRSTTNRVPSVEPSLIQSS